MSKEYFDDVVISSRIRFARNLSGRPFPGRADEDTARETVMLVRRAIDGAYAECDFDSFTAPQKQSYVEKHIISPEFARSKTPCALFSDDSGVLRIMVGEEDHIRLQAITGGFSLDEAYSAACEADDMLSRRLPIAFDDKRGYLTRCPTNLGTGMRASVMVFLPGLTLTKRIRGLLSQLGKLGLAVRGIYGEGSEARGCIYQISNRETMGVSEKDTIEKLSHITAQVIRNERAARSELDRLLGDRLIDRVMRSLGKLRYAYLLSLDEFIECYADVRMGVSLGIVKDTDIVKLDFMFSEVMPGALMSHTGCDQSENSLMAARARRVKELI